MDWQTTDIVIKTESDIEIESQLIDSCEYSAQEQKSTCNKSNKVAVFDPQYSCKCKLDCADVIDVNRQKEYFDHYFSLANWSQKTIFLRAIIEKQPVKPVKTLRSRNFVSKYYLIDGAGIKQRVCSSFIEKMLQVHRTRLFRASKSIEDNPEAMERRGIFLKKKSSDDAINLVKQFIEKFPTFESHHNKTFLHPQLNLITLFRMYCDYCKSINKDALKYNNFRNIFKTNYSFSFRKGPKECELCAKTGSPENLSEESKKKLQHRKKSHMNIVERLKDSFNKCVDQASDNLSGIEVLTFDLQRAQEIPFLSNVEALNYRPLWCFNVCIFDEVRKKSYNYVWNESIALNGSAEIGSCLRKHLLNHLPENTKQVILYSNPHHGQTRNIKISLMLKHLFENHLKPAGVQTIEQRFFVNGHTQNSCNSCFNTIERSKKRRKNVFDPEEWYNLIAKAKRPEPYFVVVKMKREDFFSLEPLEMLLTNKKLSSNGNKIIWSKYESITYDHLTDPFRLVVKKYNAKTSQPISILLQKRNKLSTFMNVDLKFLYGEKRPISQEKFDDLNKLTQLIPSKYHQFYESLEYTADKDAIKDCALANRQSSDEEDDLGEKNESM